MWWSTNIPYDEIRDDDGKLKKKPLKTGKTDHFEDVENLFSVDEIDERKG